MPVYRAILAVTFDAGSLQEAEAIAAPENLLKSEGEKLWELLEIQEGRVVEDDESAGEGR